MLLHKRALNWQAITCTRLVRFFREAEILAIIFYFLLQNIEKFQLQRKFSWHNNRHFTLFFLPPLLFELASIFTQNSGSTSKSVLKNCNFLDPIFISEKRKENLSFRNDDTKGVKIRWFSNHWKMAWNCFEMRYYLSLNFLDILLI